MPMKIGGGNYTEEAIEEAIEMARIVGGLIQRRIPYSPAIVNAITVEAPVVTVEPPVQINLPTPRVPVAPPIEGPCTPTSHQWSRPIESSGLLAAHCLRCGRHIKAE